ncbi:Putative molybdopterin cofactor synthesis protein A [Minicystis rosea]|nr:Putative molybdopterin cofactor synthesis protein A [Minicystis rosea]
MDKRVVVSAACATRCPSCAGCHPGTHEATLDEVRALANVSDLYLGGGDATRWPHLATLLAENRTREAPQRIWVEAPASAFTKPVLASLHRDGAHGIRVQIEGVGEKMTRIMRVGDGEQVIAEAEALGLATEVRLAVRPKTFPIVVPLARKLRPRRVWLEIVRQDWSGPKVTMPATAVDQTMLASPNVEFSAHRISQSGYLPPCVLEKTWSTRTNAWRATLGERPTPNRSLPICDQCALNKRCQWDDVGALSDEAVAAAKPIANLRERRRATEQAVPDIIVKRRPETEVVCVTPWTTIEIVDPDGKARQCCSTWTVGDRGVVLGSSMLDVWNGPGYQAARRMMANAALGELCMPICSRLHDRKFEEKRFRIQSGSEVFVKNQLLLADEIAQRKEVLEAMPLRLAICPSTYCNYNCIMCDHGRSARRDLPESIWEELPRFLPTLQSLTLLGGEPLANPHTWQFLRSFDIEKYPDASLDLVTNGSLLTEHALKHIQRCALGDVTVSFNAGTADVYERVQRGIAFEQVMKNLDALLRFRESRPWWFGITLSFVIQPAAAHTLIQFGEIAHARDLRIRLMALNPENHEGLDFYEDPDEVARVLEHVDRFIAWVTEVRPAWLPEVRAARTAVMEEAARRRTAPGPLVTLRRSAEDQRPLRG